MVTRIHAICATENGFQDQKPGTKKCGHMGDPAAQPGSKLLHVFFGCLVGFFRLMVGCGFGGVCLEDVEVLKDEVVTATYFNGKSCGNLLGDYNLRVFS